MSQVYKYEGDYLYDTACDFSHHLVVYSLGDVMEKFGFSHIEHFLACLDKVVRKDSCNDLTYIDVCRTVCKTTLVASGYKECKDDYKWVGSLPDKNQVSCVKTKEIGIIEFCCKYAELFN